VNPQELLAFDRVEQQNGQLPGLFAPLEKHRTRLALVDGLYHQIGSAPDASESFSHGSGFALLCGLPPANGKRASDDGTPGGIGIDQFIANAIGRLTAVPSLLFGWAGASVADSAATTFSAGRNQPLAHVGRPSLLYQRLASFGGRVAGGEPPANLDARRLTERRLLDVVRADVSRLQKAFGSHERDRLTAYVEAIDRFDRQQQSLYTAAPAGGAGGGAGCQMPRADDGPPPERLKSMFQMATVALRCGLTNVVGVSLGNGREHNDLELLKGNLFDAGGYSPHGGAPLYRQMMQRLYQFVSQQVADMMDGLGAVASQTVVVILSAQAASRSDHHGKTPYRFPAMLLDGTGKAKTGGRYLRYAKGDRSLSDLFCTVGHLVGAPTDTFGAGGFNQVRGPLPELVA
jgi:hypothetical protein